MYNSIYPYNINFQQNHYKKQNSANYQPKDATQETKAQVGQEKKNSDTFPNGTKVTIDYSKGQINISQVLADFRSTIIAINAPQDIREEVSAYLNLVEKESQKDEPSREIIVSNLRNASKISDNFIAKSLNKPSNVVEGWIKALFMQNINLKSDPNSLNPDFLLNFPQKAQERIDKEKNKAQTPEVISQDIEKQNEENKETPQVENENIDIENKIELSITDSSLKEEVQEVEIENSPYGAINQTDKKVREIFTQIKAQPKTNAGNTKALNLINEALGIISNDDNANKNIKAALHIERGKLFDLYDYVDYALRDYYEATKATELNLKAQAFYKTGKIYDEFNEFDPALDNYLSSVAYSGEAENTKAQSQVLTKIASLYTKQYNLEKTMQYQDLALDVAQDTRNDDLIAKTYSQTAQNYQYLGENDKALNGYKNALAVFAKKNESYEEMAYNYEQASITMDRLGNHAKAQKLQNKALQYYQKAQQQKYLQEALS